MNGTITREEVNRAAVARATGVDISHISRILNGYSRPSFDLAKSIADYLELSMDELYGLLPTR